MKKTKFFVFILLLLLGVSIFSAFTPVAEEEERYADAPIVSTLANPQISFTTRTIVEEHDTDGGAPKYTNAEGWPNACGPLAGTAIVAFYDRYYPNLIPGWESYYPETGTYRPQASSYTKEVLDQLYILMRTNKGGFGVTESNFKSGLQTYVENHGYSASYTSVISDGSLDYSACKTAIDNNKVIALLIEPGVVYDIVEYSDHDTFIEYSITGNHVMYAYGYLRVKYYYGYLMIAERTYLKVSTGKSEIPSAYLLVNSSNVESAYIVNVG